MPEGPSIVILKEAVQPFRRKRVLEVSGTSITGFPSMKNLVVTDFKSWGKHFLICFNKFTIRVHFLLFGSYRINGRKDAKPRLSLTFSNGEIHFYACSVQLITDDPDEVYDWTADVMNPKWSSKNVRAKLKEVPEMFVCDALMDQSMFSGVGNIIKNEVLYRVQIHPLSRVGSLPRAKLNQLIREAVNYSFDFLEWKKKGELKRHWLCYAQKKCSRDKVPFIKKNLGKSNRRTFYCEMCEQLYT